jgi:hypothetical protein
MIYGIGIVLVYMCACRRSLFRICSACTSTVGSSSDLIKIIDCRIADYQLCALPASEGWVRYVSQEDSR